MNPLKKTEDMYNINDTYSFPFPDCIESTMEVMEKTMASLPCAAFLLQDYLLDIPDPRVEKVHEDDMILSHDYQPTTYDVTCGRGKGYYNKPGNKRFRAIISHYVESYKPCQSRIHKTLILHQIIERVQEQDNGRAQFIRYDTNLKCWCRLSLDHTREKVGHAMRECSQSSALFKQHDKQQRSTTTQSQKMSLLRKLYSSKSVSVPSSSTNSIVVSTP